MSFLDAYSAPDGVGHSWPALEVKSELLSNHGKEQEVHNNEVVRMLSVCG